MKVARDAELSASAARLVEAATVRTATAGQGVLVAGNVVLTAAHCLRYTISGALALGDHCAQQITTQHACQVLKLAPLAVEPVADIAAIGAMDSQACHEEAEAFEAFCEATPGVPLHDEPMASTEGVRVFILTHDKGWVAGTATAYGDDPSVLSIEAEQQIVGGTSGGPIVTADGKLVGIVSHFSERGGACDGMTPRPHRALPVWLSQQIREAEGSLLKG